jgi:hypothetical protein
VELRRSVHFMWGINRLLSEDLNSYFESSTLVIQVVGNPRTHLFAVGRPFGGVVMAKSQVSGNFANVILAQLSDERLAELRQHLQKIELEVKKVIYEPNRLIDYA